MNSKNYFLWKLFSKGKTPGTTPLPEKIGQYLPPSADKLVADVGCGWGRGTIWLYLKGYSVIGTDINEKEIKEARKNAAKIKSNKTKSDKRKNTIGFQVDDAAKKINLPKEKADAVTLNGVLLAMLSQKQRKGLINEVFRILKPGGILYVAEFGQTHDEEYPISYCKHALISGEYGTVVSFKKGLKNIAFAGKSNAEIKALGKPENIEYFSHHYTKKELRGLLANFKILQFNKEKFVTRSGRRINGFVIYARK